MLSVIKSNISNSCNGAVHICLRYRQISKRSLMMAAYKVQDANLTL